MNTRSFPSPDGNYVIEICPIPMRMSHEVDSPALYETATRTLIFDPGSLWDGSGVKWSENSKQVSMNMRHYSNGIQGFELEIDLENNSATLTSSEQVIFAGSLEKVQKSMERINEIDKHVSPK